MREQIIVSKFSSLTVKQSKLKPSDSNYTCESDVRKVSSDAGKVEVFLIFEPKQKGEVCVKIHAYFSILNQTTRKPVHRTPGDVGIDGSDRCISAKFSREVIQRPDLCVDDRVTFIVDYHTHTSAPKFGDPAARESFPLYGFSRFFGTPEFADVTFIVGDVQQEFRVNKTFLSLPSKVFKDMLFGPTPAPETVPITDIHPLAFTSIVRYCYTGQLVIHSSFMTDTIHAAEKYELADLVYAATRMCIKEDPASLINLVSGDSPFTFTVPRAFIEKKVTKSGCKIIDSDNFMKLNQKSVVFVMKMLQKCKQPPSVIFSIWERCVKWAEKIANDKCAKCKVKYETESEKLRSVMQPFLGYFPFDCLTPELFERGPEASGILTNNEVTTYFRTFSKAVSKPEAVVKKMRKE